MAKNLIIVESPAKVKTLKKFLGKDYTIEASVGHVRDLPSKKLSVDEDNDFEPQYQVIPGKQKVVDKLKKAAKSAETIYLASDPDREGEAIAWHVASLLNADPDKLARIQFNEITPRAVKQALAEPRTLDESLFNSQQARRILDRLVGYKISPLLWKRVKRGISAGRVQSVALRMIVDREKERRAFEPQEYWVFKVDVEASVPPPFTLDLWKIDNKKANVPNGDAAFALEKAVTDVPFTVTEVAEKERKRSPAPPFITSTLQQDASRRLGFTAKRTMGVAQRLYEGVELGSRGTTALITYMRTDSVRISQDALDVCRTYIDKYIGHDYLPEKPRYFKTKSGAQDAHEAIRPVDVSITPEEAKKHLPNEQFRLYDLIWRRFVASQMNPARFHDTTVTVEAAHTLWRAKGERLLFPGYLAVYGKTEDDSKELPKMVAGDVLDVKKLHKEQKFTQPPPRYSEASLVKEMEDKGIGRPSTYAAIISTIQDRDYVRMEEKKFAPTELGMTVADMLVNHFPDIMEVGFTAAMEDKLDRVAEGGDDWVRVLKDFTASFNPTLEKASADMKQMKAGLETNIDCEKCGKPMVIRFGKNGEFLGCSGYPDCKNIKNFTRDDKGTIQMVDTPAEELEVVGTCPESGHDLVIRKSRTGSRFIACTGYPDCKYARPFTTGVKCPRENCTGDLVEKSSRRGKIFYSCSEYPDCDYAVWDWPVDKPCPQCDSPILTRKTTKSGTFLVCPSKTCKHREEIEE